MTMTIDDVTLTTTMTTADTFLTVARPRSRYCNVSVHYNCCTNRAIHEYLAVTPVLSNLCWLNQLGACTTPAGPGAVVFWCTTPAGPGAVVFWAGGGCTTPAGPGAVVFWAGGRVLRASPRRTAQSSAEPAAATSAPTNRRRLGKSQVPRTGEGSRGARVG